MARRPPGPAYARRWSWSPTTAGSSTRSARPRGRCTRRRRGRRRRLRRRVCRLRAGQGRAAAPGGGLGGAAAEPRAQGAGLAAPGRAGAHLEAEVPHRRRHRADRRTSRRRGTGSRWSGSRPSGSARTSLDLEDVDLVRGDRTLLRHATWRLGPGDRVGIVGVNGAGKTSVLKLLAGDAGALRPGGSGAAGRSPWPHLTQDVTPRGPARPGCWRRVEEHPPGDPDRDRAGRLRHGDARAVRLHRRPAHRPDRATSPAANGGASSCCKLLLSEPNVLLLDEPTNDLDIDTLNVLEDFLDGWPGTLVVVSHDRYFLERVTDTVWALLGDGTIGLLPGGVDQYLEMTTARGDQRSPRVRVAAVASRRPDQRAAGPKAQVRQCRGARRPQGARPDRQAAGADRRAGGRAERRDRRRRERLRALPGSPSSCACCRGEDTLEQEWLEAPRSSSEWPRSRESARRRPRRPLP